MTIDQLIQVLINYQLLTHLDLNRQVVDLTNDSRKIQKGGAFLAIKGETFDGHSVIDEMIRKGLAVIVAERFTADQIRIAQELGVSLVKVASTYRAQAILANHYFGQPSRQLSVIAVTGTNGKTTTSHLISQLLEMLNRPTGIIGTLHYKIADRQVPAVNTTPEAVTLQGLFKEMVDLGCKDAIIEASSHALALGRLWYTDIDCAIFTNLTREHLDFHQTMDHYAYAKSLLFAQLGQSFHRGLPRLAIINQDDPYASLMQQASGADVVTYSMKNPDATVFASELKTQGSQQTFQLHFQGNNYPVTLNMLGEYNVMNYLAAFSCLIYYYQVPVKTVLEMTKKLHGVTGRMQVIDEGQDFNVVIDFAHTPDAIENVLKELKTATTGELWVLFGHSGGNRDSAARPEIGDILYQWSDGLVLTADNPRHEPVEKIINELVGSHDQVPTYRIEDRREAIAFMLQRAQKGDTLVFAGKGGEAYQVIGDDYVPYDEIAVVKEELSKRWKI